ncbi:MAG TPA: sigma-70 family RNA polymerase sigma factor, partial [Ktedonobacterales bacterium]
GAAAQRFAHALPLPEDDAPFLALLDTDLGTSDHTGALDLREAINELPSGLRSVVVLRYYAGMDATEASEVLGIPAGTVRSRLHRALLQLRVRLSPPASPSAAAHQMEER